MRTPAQPSLLVHPVFFLSGVAGLGYQIVWTRMFAVGLGHEAPSMLAVVTAFFAGLALGAWLLDRLVTQSPDPRRWYAGLEALIGVWALLTIALIPAANGLAAGWLGLESSATWHWLTAFLLPGLVLLPATAAMGATLPAMDAYLTRRIAGGHTVGGLYGVNTLGAMTGTLAATFVILPALGYRTTLALFAALNFLCAILFLFAPAAARLPLASARQPMPDVPGKARLALLLLGTGLLGIGYEVLGVRVAGQVLQNTVYSFAAALAVYLLGASLGGGLYQALGRRAGFRSTLAWLLPALSFSCVLGVFVLASAREIYDGVLRGLGGGLAAGVAAEMTLALLVFGLPATLMGGTFAHLAQAARGRFGLGHALAWNTLGGAGAALVFVVLLLPPLGAKGALVVIAMGYLGLLALTPLRSHRLWLALAPVVLLPFLPASLVHVRPEPGGRILAYREGVMASVVALEDADGQRSLKVNDHFLMGGSEAAFAERRQAHLPMLLHPNPQRVLFLGVGTGITFSALAAHPIQQADGVELLREAVELMPYFEPWFEPPDRDGRLRVHVADARRFVRATATQYDLIVADLFHPARDGAGMLYAREHFSAAKARLKPNGLFGQWLPLYQLDEPMLQLIIRTFMDVFPDARAYVLHYNILTPSLLLVGGDAPAPMPEHLEARMRDPLLGEALTQTALDHVPAVLGAMVAGPRALALYAGQGSLNTDDRPLVMFRAPRLVYELDQAPSHDLLRRVLQAMPPQPAGEDPFHQRIWRYQVARNHFLRAEIDLAEGRLAEGVERMLESVRASEDFRTGYAMLMLHAQQLARQDRDGATRLLEAMAQAHPQRPDAHRALQQLRAGQAGE